MAQANPNLVTSSNQFNGMYAVEFQSKRVIRSEAAKFVLGSSETSDFVVSSPDVSDKHCEISCSGDTWLLKNLSSCGTVVVGRCVCRSGTTNLRKEAIVKLGNVYVHCKAGMEATEPPMRVLKLSVLMGHKCHLGGQNDDGDEVVDDHDRAVDDHNRAVDDQDGSNGMASLDDMGSSATNGDDSITREIHGIIDSMASENVIVEVQLKEAKEALAKILMEKSDLEGQILQLYQQDENNKNILNELLENELQCSICNEIIIDAVTLDCSHSYCSQCLVTWRKNQNICPMCRKNILYQCKTRIIDDTIDKIIRILPEDVRTLRAELVGSRRGGY